MPTEPLVKPLSLWDTPARCAFGECALPTIEHGTCLVISFEADVESRAAGRGFGLGPYAFMEAMIAAGVAAWMPSAVVLDLTKVRYEWGDLMARVLGAAREPTTVIASALNRQGLTSLVEKEMFSNPAGWLFDSLGEALAGCERKYRAEFDEEMRTVAEMRLCESGDTVDLDRQAKTVRQLLPAADVRTDQCDKLRVYYAKLLGIVEQMSDGKFHWMVIDLDSDGDIPGCVTGPPVAAGNAWTQVQAAGCLARAMSRIARS